MKSLFIVLLSVIGVICASFNPEEYVNILGGTDSRYDLSHGGSLPLIARPWGFNSWAPLTDTSDSWWFHPSDRRFYGMRITHQPSPWISDYGSFVVKASLTAPQKTGEASQYSGYSPKKSVFSPYLFSTTLMAYGTETESTTLDFTSTVHGGIMRVSFPKYVDGPADNGFAQTRRIAFILNGGKDNAQVLLPSGGEVDTVTVVGQVVKNSGGVASNFAHYFVAKIFGGSDGTKPLDSITNFSAGNSSATVDFDCKDSTNDVLTVRVATSFISLEQAKENFKQELSSDKSFDSLVVEAKSAWNDVLSRVSITDLGSGYTSQQSQDMLTTFYSCLYRASLFPRQISETDSTGKLVHWSPFDSTGAVHDGPLTTDSGFWDAYSTVYPYLSLVNRPALGTMIQGWINGYKEGGWLPKWASPGYRSSMAGSMGDVSLADAIVKKIPGFDPLEAYEAIAKDAFVEPPAGVSGIGRSCLSSYLQNGYIPKGSPETTGGTCPEVVSQSLNYMQADFAISKAASFLGRKDDAEVLMKRALNYSSIFEPKTAFFRSKSLLKHEFTEPFDQFAWGDDYTEGGPWQFKFYVPHDPQGLAKIFSSAGLDICDELQRAQTMKSTFHIGGYGTEIHEETEMPDACWGQYAHNNQPVHHMLYMFGAVDAQGYRGSCAGRGQYWLRKAVSTLYKPTADMFPGDEDNGEMSAWYILSSLGLYSLSPGTPDYVIGSPLFGRVEVDVSDILPNHASQRLRGKDSPKLVIVATGNSAVNVYVQSVKWNGVDLPANSNSISYFDLVQGGELAFEMGPKPQLARN